MDQNGSLKAIAAGTANITVKTTDGGYTATCKVTVKPVAVTEVQLDKTSVTMKVKDIIVLNASVLPENATEKAVTWSSSAPNIVKVENGKLTALAEGTATITAKCDNKTATCTVTVQKADVPAESVTLDKTTLEMTVNGTEKLTATVLPQDATVTTIEWSSSKSDIAAVAPDGTVTAKAEGVVTITAKCGEKSAECTVTVKAAAVEVTGITLNQTELNLTAGRTAALKATVLPDNAANKTVTWSSSAPEVAEVDANGTVTAKAVGSATITAQTANGRTVTCTVTVTAAEPAAEEPPKTN